MPEVSRQEAAGDYGPLAPSVAGSNMGSAVALPRRLEPPLDPEGADVACAPH
jgi:hypothetical protein